MDPSFSNSHAFPLSGYYSIDRRTQKHKIDNIGFQQEGETELDEESPLSTQPPTDHHIPHADHIGKSKIMLPGCDISSKINKKTALIVLLHILPLIFSAGVL